MSAEFWASFATISIFLVIFAALMWRCNNEGDYRRLNNLPHKTS